MGIRVVMYADEKPEQIITLGEFNPEQVPILLGLVKEYGARVNENEYVYFTSGFELSNGCFEIVVMEK